MARSQGYLGKMQWFLKYLIAFQNLQNLFLPHITLMLMCLKANFINRNPRIQTSVNQDLIIC